MPNPWNYPATLVVGDGQSTGEASTTLAVKLLLRLGGWLFVASLKLSVFARVGGLEEVCADRAIASRELRLSIVGMRWTKLPTMGT